MSTALEPLAILADAGGSPALPLPDELRRLYGGDLVLSSPCLLTNFVATIDGVIAIEDVEHSNRLVSDESDADRFVMGLLRACADAVLVGSGTMRAAPSSRWVAEQAYPAAAGEYAELRRRLGRAIHPQVAIVTGSGAIEPTHPVLEEGALVLTTERGAAALSGRVPRAAEVVVLSAADHVELTAVLAVLRERGHDVVLSEGGPHLFGSMLAAGLVDELFLTVSPLIAGRGAAGRLGLVEGAELLPALDARGFLVGVRRHGNHLFLQYRLR